MKQKLRYRKQNNLTKGYMSSSSMAHFYQAGYQLIIYNNKVCKFVTAVLENFSTIPYTTLFSG